MKALIDLHTHTLVSGHAYSTIKENVEAAKKLGFHGIRFESYEQVENLLERFSRKAKGEA